MGKFKRYLPAVVFLLIMAFTAYHSYSKMARAVFGFSVNQRIVLIDAGHGGWDPKR